MYCMNIMHGTHKLWYKKFIHQPYLSILLCQILNFRSALLPGPVISFKITRYLFVNRPVPSHSIQLTLDIGLTPEANQCLGLLRAPSRTSHRLIKVRLLSIIWHHVGMKPFLITCSSTCKIESQVDAHRNHLVLWFR